MKKLMFTVVMVVLLVPGLLFAKDLRFGWEQHMMATGDFWQIHYSVDAQGGPYVKLVQINYISDQEEYQHTATLPLEVGEHTYYFVIRKHVADTNVSPSDWSNEVFKVLEGLPSAPTKFRLILTID